MMATGLPELNIPVDGESGTPSDLTADAEECSEDVPSSSLDSSWGSQSFLYGYVYEDRRVCKEKLHATFVYHKEEGKIAHKILQELEERSGQHSKNKQWTLGLYGDERCTSVFGCIEDICEYSDTIILLWTPQFEGDQQCLDISYSIKAQKSVSKVSDIIILNYGFSDGRKPNRKNIIFNDAFPLDYDGSEYIFERMKKRMVGKKIRHRAAFPQGHQGKGERTRRKPSSKKPSSSLSKVAVRKAGDDVVQNNTLVKTRADNGSALPNDVLADDDRQTLVTLTDHSHSPANSVTNLKSSQETLLKQAVKQGNSLEVEVFKPESTGEEANVPAPTAPSDCSIQEEKVGNDKNPMEASHQDYLELNLRTRDSVKTQAHSNALTKGKHNETKPHAISPQACDEGREKLMSNEGFGNGTSHLADTPDGGHEHECTAEEQRRNADRTETRLSETLQLTRSGTQDMVSQASLLDGDSLVHTDIPNDSVTPVTSLSTSEVTSKGITKPSPAFDGTSFNRKTGQSQKIKKPEDICRTESDAINFPQSMSITASDDSRMRTNEYNQENSHRTHTATERVVEETAGEAGCKTPEESFCEETEVKSTYDSQSGQISNHEMENEITHSTVSKQIFHANRDNISEFRFSLGIRDGLDETILFPETIGMSESSEDSSHFTLSYSLEKLPLMETDYNNIPQREIRMHSMVSEPATENYQKSGRDHRHESCQEESLPTRHVGNEGMSTESDQTTLSHVASSTRFQVQMESVPGVPTHGIHPGIPASTTTGGQTKGLKPFQESWSPEAEHGISENGVKCTAPVQESRPSENLSFSCPYQSVNTLTQSRITSLPLSPSVPVCPSTVIVSVGKTDGLHVTVENNRLWINQQAQGASGSGQLPAKPNAGPDLAPSQGWDMTPIRNGAAPEVERIETDLLADSEENQPRNHYKKNPEKPKK